MPKDIPLWQWNDLTERRLSRSVDAGRREQLDLFADNRRIILLNQAHDALLCLDLAAAIASYDKIIEEHLDDSEIRAELELVITWQSHFVRFRESTCDVEQIHRLYIELAGKLPHRLRTTLLEFIVAQLQTIENVELVFIPPGFHVGLILYELGEYADAEIWLARAVDTGIQPKGRFLAYRGDALFHLGSDDLARELYRVAFLRDPQNVDLPHLADRSLHELVTDVEAVVDEPSDILPWLPVWGWLSNIFPLDLNDLVTDRSGVLASLAEAEAANSLTVPQVWYEYLRYAEYLRTSYRDDQELIRARRRLKELNDGMFRRYMKKIGGG